MFGRERILGLGLAVSVATLALSQTAAAQPIIQGQVGVQAQVVTPQPVVYQPQQQVVYQPQQQPVYVQQPQPVYVQQPQPVLVQPVIVPFVDRPRFRFGLDASIGYSVIGGTISTGQGASASGFAIGAGLRLGVQINNMWSVYYQGNIPIGFAAGQTSTGNTVGGVLIAITNSLVGEITLADIFHAGLGPAVDYMAAVACSSASSEGCVGGAGAFFGLHGRIAVTLGGRTFFNRRGVSIGIDLHPTFVSSAVFFTGMLGVGYEMY